MKFTSKNNILNDLISDLMYNTIYENCSCLGFIVSATLGTIKFHVLTNIEMDNRYTGPHTVRNENLLINSILT